MVVLHLSTSIHGNGQDKPLQNIPSLLLVTTTLHLLEPSHPWSKGKHCFAGEKTVPRAMTHFLGSFCSVP